ncbi:MAG TPA: zinc ribbon domain-containing protein [Syntrophobacteraceae bacterium]|nr:zinc ribbon domain-containing protein [Syntrophobacteraceae bacterium]
MKCPKCGADQRDESPECSRCGIVFEKYRAYLESRERDGHSETAALGDPDAQETGGLWNSLKEYVLFVEPRVNPFHLVGRILVYLLLFFWGWKFILTPMESNYVGSSFLHAVNLPFHEAGHVIFSFLGEFMGVLGGFLGQLIMPLVCFGALLFGTRDPFGASAALWWTAESLMDSAPYINDARAQVLILLGGVTGREAPGFHDWNNLLGRLGLLPHAHAIARTVYSLGIALMLVTFLWGAVLLYRQYKNVESL